jgi:hypothetical protein
MKLKPTEFFKQIRPKRKSLVAAAANAFLWGAGYLFFTRRKFLGFALLLWLFSAMVGATMVYSPRSYEAAFVIMGVAWAFLSLAFARDAYEDAKAKAREAGEGVKREEIERALVRARKKLERDSSQEMRGYARALEDLLEG